MFLNGGGCGGGTLTTTVETGDGQDHPFAMVVVGVGPVSADAAPALDVARTAPGGATLSAVLHHEAWVSPSWFLLVPMALNAFVVCPTLMLRAAAARGAGAGTAAAALAGRGLGLALAILSVSLAYFALVTLR